MKRLRPAMTQAYLHERLAYDPASGFFTWKPHASMNRWWNSCFPGNRAGSVDAYGRSILIDGRRYKAGRLALFWMTGAWPPGQVDHRNRNNTDDSFSNLRPATPLQNTANRRGWARSRPAKGVIPLAKGFRICVTFMGKKNYFGPYDSVKEASAAYAAKVRGTFGDFACVA